MGNKKNAIRPRKRKMYINLKMWRELNILRPKCEVSLDEDPSEAGAEGPTEVVWQELSKDAAGGAVASSRRTEGNMSDDSLTDIAEPETTLASTSKENQGPNAQPTATVPPKVLKQKHQDPFERDLIKVLESITQTEQNSDSMFLQSLIPYMKTLSNDDKLDFQIKTLQYIKSYRCAAAPRSVSTATKVSSPSPSIMSSTHPSTSTSSVAQSRRRKKKLAEDASPEAGQSTAQDMPSIKRKRKKTLTGRREKTRSKERKKNHQTRRVSEAAGRSEDWYLRLQTKQSSWRESEVAVGLITNPKSLESTGEPDNESSSDQEPGPSSRMNPFTFVDVVYANDGGSPKRIKRELPDSDDEDLSHVKVKVELEEEDCDVKDFLPPDLHISDVAAVRDVFPASNINDDSDMFGKHVTASLRALNHDSSREKLKMMIECAIKEVSRLDQSMSKS